MSGRDVARLIAAGRIVAGCSLLFAPRLVTRSWLGSDAADTTVLARAMGVRDAVIGAIALHTLDNPQVARRWQYTGALCDGVDLAASLAARRALPPAGLTLVAVVALGAIAGQAWAAAQLGAAVEAGEPES